MTISDTLMVIFTGVIATATVVYVIYSHKLWKETARNADIMRYYATLDFLLQLYHEEIKKFLTNLDPLITEELFKRFIKAMIEDLPEKRREEFIELLCMTTRVKDMPPIIKNTILSLGFGKIKSKCQIEEGNTEDEKDY